MFPYQTSINLTKSGGQPLYLQLSHQMIKLIESGALSTGAKLPGTRSMASLLSVHRKVVVQAYDELVMQSWIEVFPARGTFVHCKLPIVNYTTISDKEVVCKKRITANFKINKGIPQYASYKPTENAYHLDDGVPDVRLAPIEDLARLHRNIVSKVHNKVHFGYTDPRGNLQLRQALVSFLNDTRGLQFSDENVLITRGSQMGIYLSSKLLLSPGDNIIVGESNYIAADQTFLEHKAVLNRVAVDYHGLVVNEVEELCQEKTIKAVFVTSHRHHPTTATLCAERRMRLLALATKYNFAIIEDDYDYDFHYSNAPILPLASNDHCGNVIYIGAFSKMLAPVLRVGYMIGPKEVIDEAANLRRIIDRQGDAILEMALAKMINQGDMQRHTKKVLKIYKTRRDLFCTLLKELLNDYIEFQIPNGGMAVWVLLDKKYDWKVVRKAMLTYDIVMGTHEKYDLIKADHNGMRLGFSNINKEEITYCLTHLQLVLDNYKSHL